MVRFLVILSRSDTQILHPLNFAISYRRLRKARAFARALVATFTRHLGYTRWTVAVYAVNSNDEWPAPECEPLLLYRGGPR